MYDFMEYCLRRYFRASGWNEDNQYFRLCATSQALLDFNVPQGVSLRLSKLPSSVFKTTTTMTALPILEGSVGYLFTSRPLMIDDSASVRFRHLVDRFRIICLDHSIRQADQWRKYDQNGKKHDDYLLCGTMNLANARLEAMYIQRTSKHWQYVISGVSDPLSKSASHLSLQFQYDKGKYCAETSFTTDDGMIGIRGLYNFGRDFNLSYQAMLSEGRRRRRLDRQAGTNHANLADEEEEDEELEQEPDLEEWLNPSGRTRGYWSAGTEIYYSVADKLGGVSLGLRYRTLPPLTSASSTSPDQGPRYPTSTSPEHHQHYIPITVTNTLSPIPGQLSSSYAAQVHPDVGLCSRFDFNLNSFDSDLTAGVEWWIRERERKGASSSSSSSQKESSPFPKTVGVPDLPTAIPVTNTTKDAEEKQPIVGVIKARVGVQSGLAIMWEGRFNKLLFSLGFVGHLFPPPNSGGGSGGAQTPIIKSVGLEIQYFS